MQHVFFSFFLSLVYAFALCAPAFAIDWETFAPPSKEFSISLPVGISKIAKDDGMDTTIYASNDGDINFLIDDGTEINPLDRESQERFVVGVTDGVMEKLKSEGTQNAQTSEEDIKGKGWHGKKTILSIDGKKAMTVVVAIANNDDVAYTCVASAGDDDPKVVNFIESLVVDPSIASEAHKKNSIAHKTGKQLAREIGPILIPSLLFALFFGILIVVVFLLRRNMKKH